MKKILNILVTFFLLCNLSAIEKIITFDSSKIPSEKEMVVYVKANDWGPSLEKIVINAGKEIEIEYFESESYDFDDFEISREARRASDHNKRLNWMEDEIEAKEIYLSDAYGNKVLSKSRYITFIFKFEIEAELESPLNKSILKNANPLYGYRVENEELGLNIYKITGIVNPLASKFRFSNMVFDEYSMNYAYFEPEEKSEKVPLIIWLHGITEGGTNPYLPLLGIKSVSLAGDKIQSFFDKGAYVLIPQCPTAWLETTTLDAAGLRVWEPVDINGTVNKYTEPVRNFLGSFTDVPLEPASYEPTAKTSWYTENLMILIEDFVERNPNIDKNRIYIGGCSAGGYMTVNMLIEKPGYFAAAIPTCEIYLNNKILDSEIQNLAKIPLWFVQSKNDEIAKDVNYVSPTFERIKKAGSKNLHLTMYDGVFDSSGREFNGHYSWIYVFNNQPAENGKTVFQWLSEQKK